MRRRTVIILLVLVVGGAVASFYSFGCTSKKPAAQKERIVHADRRKIGAIVNATGVVRLRVGSEVRVGSQLSGIVKKLNVTVGSHVESGDIIAEIDDRTIQARLADAEAQAELDRASMERTRVNYERTRVLASKRVVSAQEEEDQRLALDEAKAKYQKALRDCDLVRVDLNYVKIQAPIS